MNDHFNVGAGAQPDGVAQVWSPVVPVKAKGAPWLIILAGLLAVVATVVMQFVVRPSGNSAALGFGLYWLFSLLAFLVPLAFFSVIDLKRQLNADYPSNPNNVKLGKLSLIFGGLLGSMFQVYQLATALSKALNVG